MPKISIISLCGKISGIKLSLFLGFTEYQPILTYKNCKNAAIMLTLQDV